MRIPKFFRKAAAFVMAAVTVLSMLPATTAFAAGDIGTISFSMTYDSGGNAMRYNSSADINGYTAGGTGKYKYRMSVDGVLHPARRTAKDRKHPKTCFLGRMERPLGQPKESRGACPALRIPGQPP